MFVILLVFFFLQLYVITMTFSIMLRFSSGHLSNDGYLERGHRFKRKTVKGENVTANVFFATIDLDFWQ